MLLILDVPIKYGSKLSEYMKMDAFTLIGELLYPSFSPKSSTIGKKTLLK
jgi:hypothetical protein